MNEEERESVAHLDWLLKNGYLASEDEIHIKNILNLVDRQDKVIKKALKEINNVLYFNDSSDYETGLWEALSILNPDISLDNYDTCLKYIEDI